MGRFRERELSSTDKSCIYSSSYNLLYHVFKPSGSPSVFDEQLLGTGVTLFSRLHAYETLISQTPGYLLISGSCSTIKHQCYVYTSYTMIIDPLINCLQDIIMHIRCKMQFTYAIGLCLWVLQNSGRGGEIEQMN